MMKKMLAICTFLCTVAALCAAETKIAVIDMRYVFQNYEKTKVVEKKLQEQMDTFREYSMKLNAQIQTLKKDFETARDQAQNNFALTPAERKNKELNARELYEKMAVKDAELKSYAKSRQEQIRTAYEKLRAEILAEIKAQTSAHAQVQGYTLVLDHSGSTSNEISAVVYFTPEMDITKPVLENLNRAYQEEKKKEAK